MSAPVRTTFDRILTLIYLLLWPPFFALASRQSLQPEVFGLWSKRLLAVICVYALLLVAATVIVFHPRLSGRRERLQAILSGLRRSRFLWLLAAAAPFACWFGGALLLMKMGIVASPIVIACLANLALLAFLAEVLLQVSGLAVRRQVLICMKVGLAAFATMATLMSIEVVAGVSGLGKYASWDINPKNLDVRFQTDDFDTRVVTNVQGLREPDEILPDHPGVYRILVVGDSMTFGWGVESNQVYHQVAESRLQATHRNVEIINMGRAGAGPLDYHRFVRDYAPRLKPDLIVLGFLIGNDIPVQPPANLGSQDEVRRRLTRQLAPNNSDWLNDLLVKSFLVRLAQRLTGVGFGGYSEVGKRGPVYHDANPLDPSRIDAMIGGLKDPDAARRRYQALLSDGWIEKGLQWRINPWLMVAIIKNPTGMADSLGVREETRQQIELEFQLCSGLLKEIKRETQTMNGELLVLAIPHAHLVSQRWVDFMAARGCIVNDRMTRTSFVNDWLSNWCGEHQVGYFDPLPEFRRRTKQGVELYLQTDDHMNADGQQLLGDALAKKLAKVIPASFRIE